MARWGAVVVVLVMLAGIPGEGRHNVFEPDGNGTLTAFVSTALLLGAAAAVARWGRARPRRRSAFGFAAVLVVMGVDELTGVRLAAANALGVPWELLSAPVAGAAVVVVVRVWPLVDRPRGRRLLGAGVLAFLIAQGIDQRGFVGPEVVDDVFDAVEEYAEMVAALLVWVAFAPTSARPGAPGPASPGSSPGSPGPAPRGRPSPRAPRPG